MNIRDKNFIYSDFSLDAPPIDYSNLDIKDISELNLEKPRNQQIKQSKENQSKQKK